MTALTNFEMVGEFHRAFGHPIIGDKPYENVFTENPKLVTFRLNLIKEEIDEFCEAASDLDFTEMMDACGDILYVIYGAFHCISVNPDLLVSCSNYKSKTPVYAAELELSNKHINDLLNVELYMNVLLNSYKCLESARDTANLNLFVDALCRLIVTVYWVGSMLDFDLNAAFKIIQNSNMSKVCKTEEEAQKSVEWYKANESRYKQPSYKQAGDGKLWIVYDAETSKALKSHLFVLPNFSDLLIQ